MRSNPTDPELTIGKFVPVYGRIAAVHFGPVTGGPHGERTYHLIDQHGDVALLPESVVLQALDHHPPPTS